MAKDEWVSDESVRRDAIRQLRSIVDGKQGVRLSEAQALELLHVVDRLDAIEAVKVGLLARIERLENGRGS